MGELNGKQYDSLVGAMAEAKRRWDTPHVAELRQPQQAADLPYAVALANTQKLPGDAPIRSLILVRADGTTQPISASSPIVRAVTAILTEYLAATAVHSAFYSAHEGFAVIEEEFIEFRAEVFKNPKKHPERALCMRMEAVQLGAMVLRFLTEIAR